MCTIRSDKPLAQVTHAVLKLLHWIAKKHNANYFIIGATARDLLMTHVFGIDAGRAPAADQAHRLYYRQQEFGTGDENATIARATSEGRNSHAMDGGASP